jgi:hypothetical protein
MTNRRKSSPYPHPPSAFVRDLTSRGWRRYDAEALAIVAFCLEHADDDASLPTLARYATDALGKEPVLAGAVLLFARKPGTAYASRRLWSAASFPARYTLAMLCGVAVEHEVATELEFEEERRHWEDAG